MIYADIPIVFNVPEMSSSIDCDTRDDDENTDGRTDGRTLLPISANFYLNLAKGYHCADDVDTDLRIGLQMDEEFEDELEEQCHLQTYEELLADSLELRVKYVRFSPCAIRM